MDDLADFEFFHIILEAGSRKLRLPNKFTELLDGREPREVKLREDGGGSRLWDVEVVFDSDGHMYLGHGWERFAHDYDVQLGHFLVFSYDGDAVLTVKVFDGTMCRRHYKHDDDNASTASVPLSSQSVTIKDEDFSISPGSESSSDSGSKNSSIGSGSNGSSSKAEMEMEMDIDDGPKSQFTVMLRECHLGKKQKQYLNVPIEFQAAHGYAERSKVVLRMRGKSWTVNLKHNIRTVGKPRTSLRYGWNQFCVDNRLAVGDTCFFRALRGGDAGTGHGKDHVLKVEVRKRDGTFAH